MFGQRTRTIAFYAAMTAALLVLMTGAQLWVLPDDLGVRVGHNSEAILFAIIASAEIQFLRGRLRTTALVLGQAAVGVLLVVLGLGLRTQDLGQTLTTLNEPIVGSGFLLLYLCLPRSRVVAIVCAVVVTLAIVVFYETSFVLQQAESLVPLVLAGPAIDIFYPRLLTEEPAEGRRLQVCWMLVLGFLAVVLMPLAGWARDNLTGSLLDTIDYLQRAAEGYWGWILVYAYFAFWLGAAYHRSRSDDRHGPAHRATGHALGPSR